MRAKGFLCGLLAVALLAGGCRKKYRDLTTDLHRAASKGDLSQVQMLITRRANVNARDDEGQTPLHLAAENGHKEVVEVLVRCGARIDCEDKSGLTPAMLAMYWGRRTVVERLVQMGATVDLYLAVYLGDTEKAKSLIRSGATSLGEAASTKSRLKADVMVGGRNTWTPLHYAAACNRKEIGDLLIAAGARIDARDSEGRTPLHLAARGDCTDVMELLLSRKAPLNAQDRYGNTALHFAVDGDHANAAGLLVSAGADMEVAGQKGETPLYLAAQFGRTESAALLVAHGASVNARMAGKTRSRSPLSAAISEGYIEIVRLLAPKLKGINSDLPLHEAIISSFDGASFRFYREHSDSKATFEDRRAAEQQEIDNLRIRMVELLLSDGADVNQKDEDGWTPLHCAASQGLADIAQLLMKKGANVHAKATKKYGLRGGREESFAGITPLHEAAVSAEPGIVELLIAHGAEVDAKTDSGKTPLHYAAGYRHIPGYEVSTREWYNGDRHQSCDVIELLIRKGADVNAKDDDGATPLRYALQNGRRDLAEILIAAGAEKVAVKNEGNQTMLHDALRQKDFDLIRLLLINGAEPEEQDEEGNTLLHLAARDANQELVRLLLAYHANVNARNRGGITPLCYAASGGAVDLAALLLADGAEVNARDNGGDTALHGAALHGHKEVVQLLLVHGADVNARNSRGRTPLDEANRRGHADVVQLLTAKTEGASAGAQNRGAGR